MLAALRAAQSARGQADVQTRRDLFAAHQAWAEELVGARLDEAVAALAWPLGGRVLDYALDGLRIPSAQFEQAERGGLARSERRLRRSKRLPEGFAANPAQSFFLLQRQTAERRRRAAEDDGLSSDDTVRLAA